MTDPKKFDKQIIKNPNDPKAYYNRGLFHMNNGRHQQALDDFSRAIELDSKFFEAWYNRGFVKKKLRKYPDAIKDFDVAISLNRENPHVYYDRGLCFHLLGKLNSAFHDYSISITLGSRRVHVFHSRGVILEELKNYEGALKDFETAYQLDLRKKERNAKIGKDLERVKRTIVFLKRKESLREEEQKIKGTNIPSSSSSPVLVQERKVSSLTSLSVNSLGKNPQYIYQELRERVRHLERIIERKSVECDHHKNKLEQQNRRIRELTKKNKLTNEKLSSRGFSMVLMKRDVDHHLIQNMRIPFDELKLGKVIGKGSFGIVFEGEWERREVVAIKEVEVFKPMTTTVLSSDENSDESTTIIDDDNDVIREFQQQIGLFHPNIVRVYGYCVKNPNTVCIIMEKMDMNLLLYIRRKKRSIVEKIDIMRKIVNGLHYLHSRNPIVLHRDMKSVNILVSHDGKQVKLTDFGLSTTVEQSVGYKVSGFEAKGTAYYIAPEAMKDQLYSAECDIYGLSIVFWEILFETIPYQEQKKTALLIMYDVCHFDLRPDISHPSLPKEMKKLLVWMWDKNRKKRPSTTELLRWFGDSKRLSKLKDFPPETEK